MNDALRRAMIAAGVDPDKVAAEAKDLDLNAPTKAERRAMPVTALGDHAEQLGLDVGVATGVVTIQPGTKKHASLAELRGALLDTNQVEFLAEFREAALVAGDYDSGWTISANGLFALGVLDHGRSVTLEGGKLASSAAAVQPQPAPDDRRDEVTAVREEAIARADRPPSQEWKAHAAEVIEATARAMPYLTSEDVWNHGLRQPDAGSPDGDALGPAMRRAKDAGLIEPTDRTTTSTDRPQRHNNPKRVWKSRVYDGD
jgi:hypothetical protein